MTFRDRFVWVLLSQGCSEVPIRLALSRRPETFVLMGLCVGGTRQSQAFFVVLSHFVQNFGQRVTRAAGQLSAGCVDGFGALATQRRA